MWKRLPGYFAKIAPKYWKKKNSPKENIPMEEPPKHQWQFSDYISQVSAIVLYMRRERGIARRDLELTVIDHMEEPAWKIEEVLKNLMRDPQVMYLITDRPEAFAEMEEELMEGYGLPFVILENEEREKLPGNLILDLNLWENQLDRFGKIWV